MSDRAGHPLATPGLHLQPGPGGAHIAGPDGSVHYLNQTAAAVWLHADGSRDLAALAGALAPEFGLAEPPLADVERAIALLRDRGLVQPPGG
ncbi:PqqD family protein [Thetidibacter halocola]|uniref:PqqD family protein n=1 Tax=Thetidibacter halocola TaxID=2827239 RepID=A0A8J8B7M7_9RHOB|nr:PqqD family protein [Thetidibacter halocola]MBS0124577.1 PqqD family protein [Thetidibacter halocola]